MVQITPAHLVKIEQIDESKDELRDQFNRKVNEVQHFNTAYFILPPELLPILNEIEAAGYRIKPYYAGYGTVNIEIGIPQLGNIQTSKTKI